VRDSEVSNQFGAVVLIPLRMVQREELPRELFRSLFDLAHGAVVKCVFLFALQSR
jgi:hypothetical protein